MQSTPILILISSFSILLPTIIGLFLWKKLDEVEKGLLFMLLSISGLQLLALLLSWKFSISNHPVYHVYILLEFNFLFWLYYRRILGRKKQSTLLLVALASSLAFVLNGLFVQDFLSFPSHSRVIESFLVLLLSGAYFYQLLQGKEPINLFITPAFWVSVAIVLYYTPNMLLFMYGNYIEKQSPLVFYDIWRIHSILNIILYSTYTVALLCRKKS